MRALIVFEHGMIFVGKIINKSHFKFRGNNLLNRGQIKRLLLFLLIGALTSCSALLFLRFELIELVEDMPFNKELKIFLMKRLVKVGPLLCGSHEAASEGDDLIYVLGGDQDSLKYRFKTATDLYHQGIGKKILILSEPGITEYDPVIERNLTNDEWAIRQLVDFGVKQEDIEPVSLEKGFWGTFTEAKGISALVFKSGYRHLTLVSSPYHTMRVWVTFSRFLQNRNVTLSIYASNDHANLRNLLLEYFKLVIYENVVLYNTPQKLDSCLRCKMSIS